MTYLKKSPWIIHYDASSCNGCDIEVLACLTPVYDVERLGVINTGNPKHADIFLVTGAVNDQNKDVIQNIYHQMPDPKVVVAIGICAASGNFYSECYNILGGVDKVIPVDVYVPGCAARPESIIDGVLASLKLLDDKHKKLREMASGLETLDIGIAAVDNAQEILDLQKLAYRSEAEIYSDFLLSPLTQTLDELKQDFSVKVFLKVMMSGKIVGSVRAYMEEGTCHIGRLVVNPLYQNMGIGARLLSGIEAHFPQAQRYELFTGQKSKRNIYFYTKRGYRIFRRAPVTRVRERVYMEKIVSREKTAD